MDLSRLEPVNVQPLNEIVYGRLLDAIVSGKLPPGTEVTIAKLADQLGVSLMPVREALRKLEAGNFVSIKKNRRIMIKELSASDLNELLEIRLNLESMAARKAARNCTDETIRKLERLMEEIKAAEDAEHFLEANRQFHYTLYRTAKMPILLATIRGMWERVSPYLHIYVAGFPDYKALKIQYHEGILQGMRERDPDEVCKYLALDLNKAAELITGILIAKKE